METMGAGKGVCNTRKLTQSKTCGRKAKIFEGWGKKGKPGGTQ